MQSWIRYGHALCMYSTICALSLLFQVLWNEHVVIFWLTGILAVALTVLYYTMLACNCLYGKQTHLFGIFGVLHINPPVLVLMLYWTCVNSWTFPLFLPLQKDWTTYAKYLGLESVLFLAAWCYKQAQRSYVHVTFPSSNEFFPGHEWAICVPIDTVPFSRWSLEPGLRTKPFVTRDMQWVTFMFLSTFFEVGATNLSIYRYRNLFRLKSCEKEAFYQMTKEKKDGVFFKMELVADEAVRRLYEDDYASACLALKKQT